jgi:hypothetical protein
MAKSSKNASSSTLSLPVDSVMPSKSISPNNSSLNPENENGFAIASSLLMIADVAEVVFVVAAAADAVGGNGDDDEFIRKRIGSVGIIRKRMGSAGISRGTHPAKNPNHCC